MLSIWLLVGVNTSSSVQSAQCIEALSDVSSASSEFSAAETAYNEAQQALYATKEKWLPELEGANKRLTEAIESLQKCENEIQFYENQLDTARTSGRISVATYSQSVQNANAGISSGSDDFTSEPGWTFVEMLAAKDTISDIESKLNLARNKYKASQSKRNLAKIRIESCQKRIESAQNKYDSSESKKFNALQDLISAREKAAQLCSECEQKYCENTRMYEIDCPR